MTHSCISYLYYVEHGVVGVWSGMYEVLTVLFHYLPVANFRASPESKGIVTSYLLTWTNQE